MSKSIILEYLIIIENTTTKSFYEPWMELKLIQEINYISSPVLAKMYNVFLTRAATKMRNTITVTINFLFIHTDNTKIQNTNLSTFYDNKDTD